MRRGDTSSEAYVVAAAAWARDVLAALVAGTPPEARVLPVTDGMTELQERFGLDALDRRVLTFVLGVERSIAAGRLVRELSGRGRLTVEVARAALGEEAAEALSGRGRLRAHGLCVVEGIPAGVPEPGAKVGLAPGMAARLAGLAPTPDELGPGIEVHAPKARPTLPDPLAAALRDHLVNVEPGWVTVLGARAGDAALLADALAHRLEREAVVVDGRAAGGLDPALTWSLLAAVRRECDLRGWPLLVDATVAVRGAWRALAAPPPAGARTKPLVLVNPEGRCAAPKGFELHEVVFYGAPAVPLGDSTEKPVDRMEVARRQAAIDAAIALGKPIPGRDEPLRSAIARGEEVPEIPPPPPAPPPSEPPPPEPIAAAPPPPARAPTPPPRAPTPPPAPPVAEAAPPPPPPPPPPPRPAAAAPPPPAEAEPEEDFPPDPADELPYIFVPEEAALNDLIRIAYQTPNPKQRAELMTRLSKGGRDVNVLKLLRAQANSAQPRIRTAAEKGLAKMFGQTWGKAKPIAPPVQPPRSDEDT